MVAYVVVVGVVALLLPHPVSARPSPYALVGHGDNTTHTHTKRARRHPAAHTTPWLEEESAAQAGMSQLAPAHLKVLKHFFKGVNRGHVDRAILESLNLRIDGGATVKMATAVAEHLMQLEATSTDEGSQWWWYRACLYQIPTKMPHAECFDPCDEDTPLNTSPLENAPFCHEKHTFKGGPLLTSIAIAALDPEKDSFGVMAVKHILEYNGEVAKDGSHVMTGWKHTKEESKAWKAWRLVRLLRADALIHHNCKTMGLACTMFNEDTSLAFSRTQERMKALCSDCIMEAAQKLQALESREDVTPADMKKIAGEFAKWSMALSCATQEGFPSCLPMDVYMMYKCKVEGEESEECAKTRSLEEEEDDDDENLVCRNGRGALYYAQVNGEQYGSVAWAQNFRLPCGKTGETLQEHETLSMDTMETYVVDPYTGEKPEKDTTTGQMKPIAKTDDQTAQLWACKGTMELFVHDTNTLRTPMEFLTTDWTINVEEGQLKVDPGTAPEVLEQKEVLEQLVNRVWQKSYDENEQKFYWWNQETGESQWDNTDEEGGATVEEGGAPVEHVQNAADEKCKGCQLQFNNFQGYLKELFCEQIHSYECDSCTNVVKQCASLKTEEPQAAKPSKASGKTLPVSKPARVPPVSDVIFDPKTGIPGICEIQIKATHDKFADATVERPNPYSPGDIVIYDFDQLSSLLTQEARTEYRQNYGGAEFKVVSDGKGIGKIRTVEIECVTKPVDPKSGVELGATIKLIGGANNGQIGKIKIQKRQRSVFSRSSGTCKCTTETNRQVKCGREEECVGETPESDFPRYADEGGLSFPGEPAVSYWKVLENPVEGNFVFCHEPNTDMSVPLNLGDSYDFSVNVLQGCCGYNGDLPESLPNTFWQTVHTDVGRNHAGSAFVDWAGWNLGIGLQKDKEMVKDACGRCANAMYLQQEAKKRREGEKWSRQDVDTEYAKLLYQDPPDNKVGNKKKRAKSASTKNGQGKPPQNNQEEPNNWLNCGLSKDGLEDLLENKCPDVTQCGTNPTKCPAECATAAMVQLCHDERTPHYPNLVDPNPDGTGKPCFSIEIPSARLDPWNGRPTIRYLAKAFKPIIADFCYPQLVTIRERREAKQKRKEAEMKSAIGNIKRHAFCRALKFSRPFTTHGRPNPQCNAEKCREAGGTPEKCGE